MNWQAWQAIAEVIAAAGVIISLLYLAAQIRQNTRSVQSAANQELLATYQAAISFSSESRFGAELFHAVLAGRWSDLSEGEQTAGRQIWIGILRMFEHAFLQHRAGLLPDGMWGGWAHQMLLSASLPGFRSVWPACTALLNPDFVEWVEGFGDDAVQALAEYTAAVAEGGARVTTVADVETTTASPPSSESR
jgi:hypothetical protein